jgi:hypothetical protein
MLLKGAIMLRILVEVYISLICRDLPSQRFAKSGFGNRELSLTSEFTLPAQNKGFWLPF